MNLFKIKVYGMKKNMNKYLSTLLIIALANFSFSHNSKKKANNEQKKIAVKKIPCISFIELIRYKNKVTSTFYSCTK